MGRSPSSIAIDSNTGKVYVNQADDTISIINGTNETEKINVGKSPIAIAVDSNLQSGYTVNQADGTVTMFNLTDTDQKSTIPVGSLPTSIAIDSTGKVYVTNQADDTISVINGNNTNILKTIPMADGKFPTGIAIDVHSIGNENRTKLYVADIEKIILWL